MIPALLVIGENVEFEPQRFDGNAPTGVFVVVGIRQRESGTFEYRVRHLADGYDLIARGSEIRRVPGIPSPAPGPDPIRHAPLRH
ncbi:hypothetical protein [Muricoccus radiodurans]|uniref:hypothetical protein n=1 Tax=Muricoccus radiodurans TaxID=2231721 RepID=UPI003CEC5FA4